MLDIFKRTEEDGKEVYIPSCMPTSYLIEGVAVLGFHLSIVPVQGKKLLLVI